MPPLQRPKILVIDDVPAFLEEVSGILSPEFKVQICASPLKAITEAPTKRFNLVITTLIMKEIDGFDVIRQLRGAGVLVPIIMVTGHGTANTAIEALRLGASDYLSKPVEPEELRARVRRALEAEAADGAIFQTRDGAVLKLLRLVKQVAASESRVLITGETGTGKELIAQTIHQQSSRREGPFVAINCAAIPAELIESELFGHEAGAFTGALKRRVGRLEEAGQGTLFLDEIGELSIALQSKLLRVLQGGDFQKVGGSISLRLNARVLAATNRDLRVEMRAGRFREDLFFRLNVVSLQIPPLRERKGDVRFLGTRFIRRFASSPRMMIDIAEPTWKIMENYDWPGNVRELEHFIERLSVLFPGQKIDPAQVTELTEVETSEQGEKIESYSDEMLAFQKAYFRRVLSLSGGNLTRAAKMAGMDKGQFHRMIVRIGVHPRQTRDG